MTPGSAPALVPGATATDKFIGICLEFNECLLSGNNSYDLKFLDAAPIDANGTLPTGMGTDKANHIATLLTSVFPDFGETSFNNATNIAALQIAIWEIVHETTKKAGLYFYDPRDASVDKGVAYWSSPLASVNQAWIWLNVLNTTIATNPSALVDASTSTFRAIVDKDSDQQDFIVQLRSDAPPVPIPAAAWLLGSGLLGLFGLGRRRQKTAEALDRLAPACRAFLGCRP